MGKRDVVTCKIPVPPRLPVAPVAESGVYPFWRRLVVLPGHSARCYALASAIKTCRVHFQQGTYVPCLWDFDLDCPHHGQSTSPRLVYQGSLPVAQLGSNLVWLLNVTASALRTGPELETRTDLLGKWLAISRAPGGRNARMTITLPPVDKVNLDPERAYTAEEIYNVQLNIWRVRLEFDQAEGKEGVKCD